MKSIIQRLLLGGTALGLAVGASSAAVTLTEDTVTLNGSTFPVYVVENQYIKFLVISGPVTWTPTQTLAVPNPYYGAIGGVLALYDKTGQVPGASQLTVIGGQGTANNPPWDVPKGQPEYEWPGVSQGKSYLAFRDRMNARDPNPTDPIPTITKSLSSDQSTATITVEENSLISGYHIKKTYILKDNVKWLQTDFAWTNNNSAPYNQPGTGSAIESIIYAVPGGSKDNADTQFAMIDANANTGTVAGLNASIQNQWYGKGAPTGQTNLPKLTQGWLSIVDPGNQSVLATTWDLAQQEAVSTTPGLAGVRGGVFGSRFTFEILYESIPANSTLNFTHNLIVDNGLTEVTYAKEGELLAAVETSASYNLESTATATFKLNSLNPTSAVTYDIKNIRVEDRNTGTVVSGISLPDITGVNVPSNAHVTAGTRQFTPRAPGFVVNSSYVVKGDLYVSGQSTPVATLSSRPFLINPANAKVLLYQDPSTGDYVLENEVYRAVITGTKGEVSYFYLKDLATGNLLNGQTVTSTPPYPMFRDYTQPVSGQAGFQSYTATLDPNGTDNANSKSIRFDAITSVGEPFAKTYSLDSMSRSLKVNLNLTVFGDVGGAGFYSEVPMAPGGTAGSSDRFTAHTADGLIVISPPQDQITKDTEFWMGAKNNAGTIVAADLPELDQPWIGMRDAGSTKDALAISWDLSKQKQFSASLNGGPVTMNSLLIKSGYQNQIARVHFTNLPAGEALDTNMYLMSDSGFTNVSYAEGNRVLAGLWANASNNPAGAAFAGTAALTNTSTTAKTFNLKNIRIVKDSGESTPAGPDITGIAVQPAAQERPAITFTLPSGQAEGSYTLVADLYDGGTKVTTLLSLPFNVTAGVPGATGDVDNNGKVEAADVKLALQIAGGVVAADAGNVSRGDLNGDGKITVEDAVAIAQKVNAPS